MTVLSGHSDRTGAFSGVSDGQDLFRAVRNGRHLPTAEAPFEDVNVRRADVAV